jgi:hypothetical protein
MSSNTRLASDQKADRKMLIENLPAGSQLAQSEDKRVTVLIVPAGVVSHMSVAIGSEHEHKFRRKVGEYVALCRYFDGQYTIVPPKITAQVKANYMSDVLSW